MPNARPANRNLPHAALHCDALRLAALRCHALRCTALCCACSLRAFAHSIHAILRLIYYESTT
eukprot:9247305-Alexandrium_andersonii.AAC.1